MKTQTTILISLLLCGLAFSASAQYGDPAAPAMTIRQNRATHHQRKTEQLPTGGFWMSESNRQKRSPVIIHYYDDQLRELQTDTLSQKRLNLKRRMVIRHLNERLASVLQTRPQPVAIARPTP